MQLIHSTGLHRPDPAKLARRKPLLAHPRFASGTPRGSAMLEMPDVLDQGQTSTCPGHSFSVTLWCALKALGIASPIIASPKSIMSLTYSRVRKNESVPGGDFPMLLDTGADLSDVSAVGASWGVAPILAPTSDGRNSDVEAMGLNGIPLIAGGQFPEPDTRQIQIAGSDLISGEYSIPVDNDIDLACALLLDAGVPIWIGGPVAQPYEDLGPSQVATGADTVGGAGHAQGIRGYQTTPQGRQYRVRGSWNKTWADHGEVWADPSFLLSLWMAWPMAVKVSS